MPDLPANVRPVADRHGKIRYRFRRKGWPSAYLRGVPGSAEFHSSLADILRRGPSCPKGTQTRRKIQPRSLDDLFQHMKTGTKWGKKKASTQRVQGRILERFMDREGKKSGRRFGDRPVADVTVAWLDQVFAGMSETPAAANVLRKTLSGLMDHAVRLGWRTDNPVRWTDSFEKGPGLTPWSEDDITAFRKTHALGTMARMTLELALNTAARRCNIATITRDDIRDGMITVDHAKDNNTATVPLLPTTKAAMDALPAAPIKHLVVTQFGSPFSIAGLGNRMRKWCDEAGLQGRSLHGLRKAVSRRIAESGGTDAEGQSVTGHKKAETFAFYRASANRRALAEAAMSNVLSTFDKLDISEEE